MDKQNQITKDILIKLNAGNHDAFLKIYDAYHQDLYNFTIKYLQDPPAAEDIIQQVFMKLWEIRERVKPELPVINYLFRITRNAIYKELKRFSEIAGTKAVLQITSVMEEPSVEALYQDNEYQKLVLTTIDRLPTQRKRIFKLCRQDGKTYKEVAHQLSISPYTVKEHMTLATKSIKDYVHQHTGLSFNVAGLYILGAALAWWTR